MLLLDEYAKTHYKELFPQAQDIPENDMVDSEPTSIRVRDLTKAKSYNEIIDLAVEKIVDRAFAFWTTTL